MLESVVADNAHPPTSTTAMTMATTTNTNPTTTSTATAEPIQATSSIPTNVITIEDDNDEVQPSWKQSNSMKIEALISGPNTEKKD